MHHEDPAGGTPDSQAGPLRQEATERRTAAVRPLAPALPPRRDTVAVGRPSAALGAVRGLDPTTGLSLF